MGWLTQHARILLAVTMLVLSVISAGAIWRTRRRWKSEIPGSIQRMPRKPLLGLLCCLAFACTPAERTAAGRKTTAAAIDLLICAERQIAGPALQRLGEGLSSEGWREWGEREAASAAGACGLHALATALRSSSPASPARVVDLELLHDRCEAQGDSCQDAAQRAAWILWRAHKAGRVRLLPSGEG